MITAVILILAIYLAVRFMLSETSQKLKKVREAWDQTLCKSEVKPKRKFSDVCKKSKVEKDVRGTIDECASSVPQPLPRQRRRTGAIETRAFPRRPRSRNQMHLPFMDTGLFQGGGVKSSSPQTTVVRKLSREQKYGKEINAQAADIPTDGNIVNMFKIPTEDRRSNFFTRVAQHVSFILQRNSTINYPDVSEEVLSSERVKNAIKTAVMEEFRGQNPDDAQILTAHLSNKQRAVRILQDMRSCISSFLLKVAAWVMYKLLGRMLDGIEVHREQIETIKRASEHGVPLIYLPLHRSHLDYILVTFILYMNNLRAPLVAAGNNLMIPFFGALLRGLGAFFIKRKLDPQQGQRDFVYRAILHTYMEKSLEQGHSLEFFIEGGRSRTGKAVLPKAGLLSIVVDTLLSGVISDAYIVPIAMSYEKLLDGNFIAEQMGKPKKMESFPNAVRAIWRTLHSSFGTVRVDFCQPFSLKEFLLAAEYSYNMPKKTLQPCVSKQNCFFNHNVKARRHSEYGTEIVTEDHRQVIKDLADYIVYDAFNANALMSTNIVAFLMVTKHRKGATYHQLLSSVNWLRGEISKRNKSIGFIGDSAELIRKACSLFNKDLVTVETVQMEWSSGDADNNVKITFYKPAVSLPEILELQYYANAVLPVFLLESVVINAFCALAADSIANGPSSKYVLRGEVLKKCLELCSMLQYEFIFSPPGTSLYRVLNATIDELICMGLLKIVDGNENGRKPSSSASFVADCLHQEVFFEEEELEIMCQQLEISHCEDHSSMVPFLKCILSPFIEACWLVSVSLLKLTHQDTEETVLLQEIRKLGQKKLHLGHLCHEECLGLDLLKNSLKLFESWKIIKSSIQSSQKVYSICPPYTQASLDDVISRIEKYKR